VEEVMAGGHQVASLFSLSSLTGLQPKLILKQMIHTAQEGERTPHELINVSFNFNAIFRLRYNLDMQFSELYS